MRGKPAVRCELCPKNCELADGMKGDCRVRYARNGKLYTLVYGKACSVHIDPMEKKPMYHFLPGTPIFSIATAGCNLHCKYCQNWEISQAEPEDLQNYNLPPEDVVKNAIYYNCKSIAYTYSEPIIFYEYTFDTCSLAMKFGLKNVLVTAGFINEKPLRELCRVAQGANVDLKGFTEEFYINITTGRLKTIMRTLEIMLEEGVWVEITNLIVPTINDDMKIIREMCRWIKSALGEHIPLHFSRFFPMYKLKHLYPTPLETLINAAKIAKEEGLKYVYVGNVVGTEWEDTYCPGCGKKIIDRFGYKILEYNITSEGCCKFCNERIEGVWN